MNFMEAWKIAEVGDKLHYTGCCATITKQGYQPLTWDCSSQRIILTNELFYDWNIIKKSKKKDLLKKADELIQKAEELKKQAEEL